MFIQGRISGRCNSSRRIWITSFFPMRDARPTRTNQMMESGIDAKTFIGKDLIGAVKARRDVMNPAFPGRESRIRQFAGYVVMASASRWSKADKVTSCWPPPIERHNQSWTWLYIRRVLAHHSRRHGLLWKGESLRGRQGPLEYFRRVVLHSTVDTCQHQYAQSSTASLKLTYVRPFARPRRRLLGEYEHLGSTWIECIVPRHVRDKRS